MLEAIADGILVVLLSVFALGLSGGGEMRDLSDASNATSTREVVEVVRVIDGDTFVTDSGNRVRLLGIDTPERDECYYEPASDFVRKWIEGKEVMLEEDVTNRDEYDRLLRYVFVPYELDGEATTSPILLNRELIKRGYATALPIGPDRQYRSEFYELFLEAEEANLGLHAVCR